MANHEDSKSKLHYLVLAIMLTAFCAVATSAAQTASPDPEPGQLRLQT